MTIFLIDASDLSVWEDTTSAGIDVYTCCSTTGVKSKIYTFTAPKTGEFAVILNNGWRAFEGSLPSEKDADVYVKMTVR